MTGFVEDEGPIKDAIIVMSGNGSGSGCCVAVSRTLRGSLFKLSFQSRGDVNVLNKSINRQVIFIAVQHDQQRRLESARGVPASSLVTIVQRG